MSTRQFITEPLRKTPVAMKADVVVVGGGPAGVGAAVRAARSGANTILVEAFGNLGGTNTTGYMFIVYSGGYLVKEIYNRLEAEGSIVNLLHTFPDIVSNPLSHYSSALLPESVSEILAFNPDVCAYVMSEISEEAGVKLLFRSLFVDVIVENNTIRAIIVENASGREAIEGKVFIDTTGRGDVLARAGVPYMKARNETGLPMPMGLMWKMANVEYKKLKKYQKEDPTLDKLIEKAKKKGELPYYRSKKTEKEMKNYDLIYTGHARLEMSPTAHPGEILLWAPAVHEWGLDGAEKVEDLIRAEVHIRKQIMSEFRFLKKYVPGFENAYISGISPFMGIREGRHPIGEYVMTYKDIKNARKFNDVVLKLKTVDRIDMRDQELGSVKFNVPYRCFLPKKMDNLLVAGDDIAAEHGAFIHMRGFEKAMSLGEIAGITASLSVKNSTTPKKLEYQVLKKELNQYDGLNV
jgi:2-polyprenyl-6-methoxyphenol hydroxylase-like FAD-dependent oxidoreductase